MLARGTYRSLSRKAVHQRMLKSVCLSSQFTSGDAFKVYSTAGMIYEHSVSLDILSSYIFCGVPTSVLPAAASSLVHPV